MRLLVLHSLICIRHLILLIMLCCWLSYVLMVLTIFLWAGLLIIFLIDNREWFWIIFILTRLLYIVVSHRGLCWVPCYFIAAFSLLLLQAEISLVHVLVCVYMCMSVCLFLCLSLEVYRCGYFWSNRYPIYIISNPADTD